MKKGLRKSISSIVATIMLSGSFIFAPIDIPEIGLKDFRFSRDPAAPQILTYDESTGKYSIDGVESDINNVPTSGDYKLESNVPIKSSGITLSSGSMSIDLNGYDLYDACTGSNKTLITLKGSAVFTLSDSQADPTDPTTGGHLMGGASETRRAISLAGTATLNMTGGIIYGFKTTEQGAGVSMLSDSPKFNFTGGMIDSCETSSSSGGGGVILTKGTFTMDGYAWVTNCKTTGTGGEKSGNGAGVNLGQDGIMYLQGHAKITNNVGKGYHGAGIDYWGSKYKCKLYISGSPIVINNNCGRGYENNVYCGKAFYMGDLETNNAVDQIGISIQENPVFTIGAKEHNDESIEEISAYFFSDRFHAIHIDDHDTYKIEPSDDKQELKQTPTVKVNFCVPNFSDSENPWAVYKTIEAVPGGYIGTTALDSNKKNYNNHSVLGWNTEPGKLAANFVGDTNGEFSDYNLYEVVLPKASGHTLCSFDDGSMGLNVYISYNEDVGVVDSSTCVQLSGFTSNPNESDTVYVDMSNIKTVSGSQFVIATFKFNPYDMTKQITEKVKFSNGYTINTGVQPSNIGKAIVNGSGYGGNDYSSTTAKQLASTMLVFGANLQNQLGYYINSAGDLATVGTEGKLKTHENISSVPNVTEKSVDVGDTALTFYGASVVYNTNIQIKHYIKLNGESAGDYTYSIDGEGDYELSLDNSGKYMYAKVNVPAYNMDHSYAVTIKDGSGTVVMTINYSIYNYIDNVITNKQGTAVYDTVQSLYWYGEDAKAYMGA
ncbi:MAG: hypothetical protein K6G47_05865 [Clostridia bacterium]|nr:hypothetical protein [Clostridia bacterium]